MQSIQFDALVNAETSAHLEFSLFWCFLKRTFFGMFAVLICSTDDDDNDDVVMTSVDYWTHTHSMHLVAKSALSFKIK